MGNYLNLHFRLAYFILSVLFAGIVPLAANGFQQDTSRRAVTDTSRRATEALRLAIADTSSPVAPDTMRFPLKDRRGDAISQPVRNPFDLKDPSNIRQTVEYDPETRQYFIVEKIGDQYYRTPTYMTFEEYLRFKARQQEVEYFRKRADVLSELNRKNIRPKLQLSESFFNRIFGTGKVDIRPQGNVDIIAGYQGQNIKNPTLPERARRNGGFDFDMNANLSILGNIGSKMKLPITYNTQANFDFENQLKLDYTGTSDEIIKRIEAGNVSFSTKGSLIPGAQSLFGIKTQLQFGKLFITGVMANQRAQRQSMGLIGGAATTQFEFKANDYEENRHFLLSQFFRKNYNKAMGSLPAVNSLVNILRIEVWVTNRSGATTETRDVVALADLGEKNPYNYPATPGPDSLPANTINGLYQTLTSDPNSRLSAQVTSKLGSLGLRPVQDFEKTFARKLGPNDYYYNPQVGFISLNQPLQADEVLGVAFQYTYNGKVLQVGEFSQDVPPDTTAIIAGNPKVLFLKLLKATSQRTTLPIFDLMMKNVYALRTRDGGYISSITPTDFKLNVLYEEPSLGAKRYLPEGPKSGLPLISVLSLDRLNNNRDPQPDGVFDFIEGYTMISNQARVIFPLLEPFGRDLDSIAFQGVSQDIRDKYVFQPLYDTIKEIAKTYANLDRYIISGTAKGQATSDIPLGAFNVPQGSVTVSAGGRALVEGIDFIVDYNLGSVKIINQAILNSGIPVQVGYENNATFGIQQRNYMGLRWDYMAKNTAKESFTFGGQIVKLGERPYFTKMNYSEDPIRNTMYGLDFSYRAETPRLTRWLDKIPFYSTSEMSTITAYGEGALLKPGHAPQIGKGESGLIYVDDFEGTRNSIDLRFPLINWSLSSTPQGNGLFPEGGLNDSLPYGYNRAKIAWYNIEPNLQDKRAPNNPVAGYQNFTDPRIRAVLQQQLFPAKTPDFGLAQLVTFDLAYYPTERGPYNFDARPGSVNSNGKLLNPSQRWGGIMRGLDQVDFETGNVEFIEFWMQDPFLMQPNSTGGQLYFNLGNVSEDVLRDGRRQFENGLPTPTIQAAVDSATRWGRVPNNPIQVTTAFSNDPADRPFQDVGFDGLDDDAERRKFNSYLNQLAANFGTGSPAYQQALADPSNDNFRNYRDQSYDNSKSDILARYKAINNPHGNSPIADNNSTITTAFTLYPDQEDLNRDNTLNELEEYFQYRVNLRPQDMVVGQNHITDSRVFSTEGVEQKWYLFRIPIAEYEQKVGNIPDFKSIRFIRMFLTGFEDSVITRFAKLELVRNQWRRFSFELDTTGTYKPLPANNPTNFNVLAVNVEENSNRRPVNYVIPPGILRVQQLSNNNINILQNEQSMSMQVCNLSSGDGRGVFKTMNMDLRQYGELKMFVHAESVQGSPAIQDKDLSAIIRIGNDFVGNYYEIRIPLKVTPFGTYSDATADVVWPLENELQLSMQRLIDLKIRRNNASQPNLYYSETDDDGKSYAIFGNPNLGEVRGMFLGIVNNSGAPACTEVWFNELRLSSLNEDGGWAATGRVDIKLADLGTVSLSGATRSIGFGNLEQRVNERSRENFTQIDAAANLEMGKLLPAKAGMSIPVYAGYSQTILTPQYDPYDLDVKLKDKLDAASGAARDSIRKESVDVTTTKTVNFTNVRKVNTSGRKQKIYSIENFDVSYSYTKMERYSPLIESEEMTRHRGGLGYNFTTTPKYWEPFKKSFRGPSKWYDLVKDFNLNYTPSLLSFRADVNRQFGAIRPRNVGGPKGVIPETYDKYFTFDRYYNLRWDLTRSLNIDFSATNRARVDEDSGRLDRAERRRMWQLFWKGGRNTTYDQSASITYTLPTSKLPLIDWTTVRLGYVARYNWLTASQDAFAKSLGNFISNAQEKNITGELDFMRLYAKSRFLRALDWDAPQPAPKTEQPKTGADSLAAGKKKQRVKRDPNELPELGLAVKVIGRILTSVKRVSVQYSETGSTSLAGYTDSTRFLGMNSKATAPGWGFVFGQQPDTAFINDFARKGRITNNPLLNNLNRQDFNQRLSITAQLIPLRDLVIDLNLDKTFGKNYSELYKDTVGNGSFARLSPYVAGSFNVSYISFQTLFDKFRPNEVTATFKRFQENRIILSERNALKNPYWQQLDPTQQKLSDGYYTGYSRYAQDVLIPSFIAAYTNKDPGSVSLIEQENGDIKSNPFRKIMPKPNWRLTYTGLTRIPALEKTFTSFTITHAYTSNLSMNSFNNNLLFQDPFSYNAPGFIDTATGNFYPYFLVPNISISEAFAPFIDIDMQFTNQLTARFEYKKSRQLSLSLIDFQLSESRSEEYTIGVGWRKRGLNLPFKIKLPGMKESSKELSNDLNMRLDLGFRDDATANSRLDQEAALPTAGQKVITISPSLDYVLNNRINIRLFFDQRRTIPKVSTSAPITTTRAGLQIRISLAQ
ncbi:cell surface protein SprA [Flavihumibacter stibioxidans]|uniref:Cell surface protein SprA n=1 Tax=Flavihumibacter stibioxidans TaxID=1834163 RepID=A0ABR7MC45_9BACT|nr:cell surface protein SprA [Flavihumibacter stibioxidans]